MPTPPRRKAPLAPPRPALRPPADPSEHPNAQRDRRALSAQAGSIRSDGDAASRRLLVSAFEASHDADPRELTHGFHSYAARFHPRLVRTLLADRAHPGAVVADPFCGSGTTLIEALVAGCRGVGSDLNPLALELSRVKALAPTEAHLRLPDELVARATLIGQESWRRVKGRMRTRSDGTQWDDPTMYSPHVFRELVGLRELFDDAPGGPLGALLRRALLLCFSAILIKVSRQASETAPNTVERTIGKGLPSRLFQRKADELAAGLRALFAKIPPGTPSPLVHKADARKLRHLDDRSVDLIITSPPYLGTYDYAEHHARRLGWLGLDDKGITQHELGARRKAHAQPDPAVAIATWQGELDEAVASMARVLRPTGALFVVIGDSRVGNRAIVGDYTLRLAAQKCGLRVVASAAEARRAPGRGRTALVEEHLVELRRA